MRKEALFCGLACLAIFAGCKMEVAPDVYLSDVQALNANAPIETSVILRLETISDRDCNEKQNFYRDGLSEGFQNVVFRNCIDDNLDTFAVFEAETVIAFWDSFTPFDSFVDGKPALFLAAINEQSDRSIFGAANFAAIEAIQRKLSETDGRFATEFDRLTISFGAEVVNDTREEQIIATGQNYYNGEPVYRQNSFLLDHRRSASIQISDVANASLMKGEAVYLFSLLDVQKIPDSEKTPSQLQEALPEE